jgi:hypothetical protein
MTYITYYRTGPGVSGISFNVSLVPDIVLHHSNPSSSSSSRKMQYVNEATINPNIPMTANNMNAPIFGAIKLDDRQNVIKAPEKIGPIARATLPPSATKPFIAPRCDGSTVRFNATVKLDMNVRPHTR